MAIIFLKLKLILLKMKNKTLLDLIYDIDLGKKAKIDKIKFIGDKKFKDRKLSKHNHVSEESRFWKFISKINLLRLRKN